MNIITPDYILGFSDGEGCFTLHIWKREKNSFGLNFTPSFSISQNTHSRKVLDEIQEFFQCGFVRKDRKTHKYEVRDLKNLEQKIIYFFQQNILRTQKKQDFLVFCEICNLLKNKAHSDLPGVRKLIDLAYSMNQKGVNRRKSKKQLLKELQNYLRIQGKVKV